MNTVQTIYPEMISDVFQAHKSPEKRTRAIRSKFLRKIQKALFAEQWSILVCDIDNKVLKHIIPPIGRIWADPFPVEHSGHLYIFLEQQFNRKNGTLGFIELFEDFTWSDFTPILECNYHLSYPNIFKHNSVWYMIPETHEHGSIDLYRAESFPDRWVLDSTLISGITAVDTSLLIYEGRFWLFTSSKCADYGLNDSLSLFYSDTFPSSCWIPHSGNPVVTTSENSRMAGAVHFDSKRGQFVRPAQSCSKEYGEHLVLNGIEELTCITYSEKIIDTVYPEKKLHAVCTHTWNRCGKYIIRDIKTRRFRLWSFSGFS